MDWNATRRYEVPRLAAILTFLLYIGFYLAGREPADVPGSFIAGAAAAVGGFFVIGRAYRPQALPLGSIVIRYHLLAALLAAGLIVHLGWELGLSPLLYIVACMFLGREVRARMIRDWRLP